MLFVYIMYLNKELTKFIYNRIAFVKLNIIYLELIYFYKLWLIKPNKIILYYIIYYIQYIKTFYIFYILYKIINYFFMCKNICKYFKNIMKIKFT